MNLKRIHLFVGFATFLIFLGTGLFMALKFPELYGENEVVRFLFRANHVYLLFSGLINVVVGLNHSIAEPGWRSRFQTVGSWLLLASVPIFFFAFVLEPPQASPMRPLTLVGASSSLLGVGFHAAAFWHNLSFFLLLFLPAS